MRAWPLLFALFTSTAQGVEITGVSAKARRIEPHLVGYNSDYYYTTNPWSNPSRVQAAVKARPGMLRYPGGTSANYWDAYRSRIFRDGITLDPADTDPAEWTQTRYTIGWVSRAYFWTNVVPLSDWRQLHDALGSQVGTIFVANLVTPGPDLYERKWDRALDRTPGSADWWQMMGDRYGAFSHLLNDAKQEGLPVRYVELGNEYYFGAGAVRAGGPADVEPYVAGGYDADRGFAYENVGAFPDRVGDRDVLYHYGVVANDWAGRVKESYPGVKVCAVAAFVDKEGYERRFARWNQEALAALDSKKVDALSLHLYGGPRVGALTQDETALGQALVSWRDFWEAGVKRSGLPPSYDLWITEFNVDDEFGEADSLPPSKGTWGNGLGNLFAVHHWLEAEPRVQIALLHELARVIVDDGPVIRAQARAYGLFARAASGHIRARAISLKGAPKLAGSGGTLPGIVAWRFEGGEHPRVALLNFTGRSQTMTGLARLRASTYVQASAALDQGSDPGERIGRVKGKMTLPAYSVTVLEGG